MELIHWLSTIEDFSLIEKIIALRKNETIDWWHSVSEAEKQSIELGLQEAELGKLNPHSKARELYEKSL